jgi:hypothetical protein
MARKGAYREQNCLDQQAEPAGQKMTGCVARTAGLEIVAWLTL